MDDEDVRNDGRGLQSSSFFGEALVHTSVGPLQYMIGPTFRSFNKNLSLIVR